MNSGSRPFTRSPMSAKLAVWPPMCATFAWLAVEYRRERFGPEPFDGLDGVLVLR